jgi:hypothetical protein
MFLYSNWRSIFAPPQNANQIVFHQKFQAATDDCNLPPPIRAKSDPLTNSKFRNSPLKPWPNGDNLTGTRRATLRRRQVDSGVGNDLWKVRINQEFFAGCPDGFWETQTRRIHENRMPCQISTAKL